jgi:hypothetical protein
MKDKFYALLLVFLTITGMAVRAQDSATCNARFQTFTLGAQVELRALDSLPGVEHFWNFGDTTQLGYGNYAGVQHTYQHSGTFRVVHLIRNTATGCHDSASLIVTINLNPPPTCGISIDNRRDTNNHQLYTFIARPFTAGGIVDTIAWRVDNNYAGMGDSLITNLTKGSHTICATLFTNLGCRSESCLTIRVGDSTDSVHSQPPPPPPPACTVSFTATPSASNAKQYTFAIQDSSGHLHVLEWMIFSVKDSLYLKTEIGQSFTYTFPFGGSFVVSLYATNDSVLGCRAFASRTIYIDSNRADSGRADSSAVGFIRSYPNPAASQAGIDVSLTQPGMIYVHVYNSMGSPVYSTAISGYTGANHLQIPLSNLQTGVYYIQVQYGNTVKRSKIQKL